MNSSVVRLQLKGSPEQHQRLLALQAAFAEVCNALAPLVQQTKIWNRVTLHHLAYKQLRERFPAIGSQMICNAIYSVSRTARLAFQHPQSPLHLSRLTGPLPLLRFTNECPVYFDRHTLSVKAGELSMYTLDGRMRFRVALTAEEEQRFHTEKLREVVLARGQRGTFELTFIFAGELDADAPALATDVSPGAHLPHYVKAEVSP